MAQVLAYPGTKMNCLASLANGAVRLLSGFNPICRYYCVGIATLAKSFTKCACILHLIGDVAPLKAHGSSEIACAVNQCCYSHTKTVALFGV